MTKQITFTYTGSNNHTLRDCTKGKVYAGAYLEPDTILTTPGGELKIDAPGVCFVDDAGWVVAARIDLGGIENIQPVE